MKKVFTRKRILLVSLAFLSFYFGNRLCDAYNRVEKNMMVLINTLALFLEILKREPLHISFQLNAIGFGLLVVGIISLIYYLNHIGKTDNTMRGKEYGSARWGRKEDIAPFIDQNFYNNIILTQTEFLTMEQRMVNPEHNRNKNTIVVGRRLYQVA